MEARIAVPQLCATAKENRAILFFQEILLAHLSKDWGRKGSQAQHCFA
jgi:hypothetical protein